MKVNANLLIIDDRAEDEKAKLITCAAHVNLCVRHPAEVELRDIESANVIVVDYRLDEPWDERDTTSTISLKPLNGLALCAVLRSHEQQCEDGPKAFLLRSGHLTDLSPQFPPDSRLHIIAAQNNLEWVFSKGGDSARQMRQIICIDEAIVSLPKSWPSDTSDESKALLSNWLGMPSEERWVDLAWKDVEECHPPLHDLRAHKHGLRLIRWMLHSILSYPCFLWSSLRLASRLRVEHGSLQTALANGLSEVFLAAAYAGALADFEGQPRWWGRGIESVLWELTEGQSFDSLQTIETLNNRCSNSLVPLSISQPVLCLNGDFRFRDKPCEISDAVRVQPDDWPAFAEQAWASIEDIASETRLRSIVISADRERMESAAQAENGE